jgi:hypothetical protein
MMNSGVSASKNSGSCTSGAVSTTSCHHTSLPGVHGTSPPVRRTTSTCSTDSTPSTATSTAAFTGTAAPRRYCPSVVTTSFAPVSSIRKRSASAEKPPKTREWMAPILAIARVMITVSGITGR